MRTLDHGLADTDLIAGVARRIQPRESVLWPLRILRKLALGSPTQWSNKRAGSVTTVSPFGSCGGIDLLNGTEGVTSATFDEGPQVLNVAFVHGGLSRPVGPYRG